MPFLHHVDAESTHIVHFNFQKVSFSWFLGELKNEVGDKPKCCVLWFCSNSQHRKLCSKNPPLYFNIMAQYLWEKKVENLPNWLKEDPVGSPTVICCPGPPLTLLLRNKLDDCKSGGRACVEPPTVNCCLLKMPPQKPTPRGIRHKPESHLSLLLESNVRRVGKPADVIFQRWGKTFFSITCLAGEHGPH